MHQTLHALTRGRAVQLAREEAAHKKTVAKLAERVKELEQVRTSNVVAMLACGMVRPCMGERI